jgi:hypothetical protein
VTYLTGGMCVCWFPYYPINKVCSGLVFPLYLRYTAQWMKILLIIGNSSLFSHFSWIRQHAVHLWIYDYHSFDPISWCVIQKVRRNSETND